MDKAATVDMGLRWLWVAVFAGCGIYFLSKPRSLGNVQCVMRRARFDSDVTMRRVEAALERREAIEQMPSSAGIIAGVACLVLAILSALTRLQAGLLYGLLCLVLAGITGMTYFYLRRPRVRRAAILSPRSSSSVIPSYWFTLSAIASLALLAYVVLPQYRTSAVIVTVSSLLTAAVAWRLTQLPAVLEGNDVEAERFVDDRVRAWRSAVTLYMAFIQPFVFCTQTQTFAWPQNVVLYGTIAIALAYCAWFVRNFFSRPVQFASA